MSPCLFRSRASGRATVCSGTLLYDPRTLRHLVVLPHVDGTATASLCSEGELVMMGGLVIDVLVEEGFLSCPELGVCVASIATAKAAGAVCGGLSTVLFPGEGQRIYVLTMDFVKNVYMSAPVVASEVSFSDPYFSLDHVPSDPGLVGALAMDHCSRGGGSAVVKGLPVVLEGGEGRSNLNVVGIYLGGGRAVQLRYVAAAYYSAVLGEGGLSLWNKPHTIVLPSTNRPFLALAGRHLSLVPEWPKSVLELCADEPMFVEHHAPPLSDGLKTSGNGLILTVADTTPHDESTWMVYSRKVLRGSGPGTLTCQLLRKERPARVAALLACLDLLDPSYHGLSSTEKVAYRETQYAFCLNTGFHAALDCLEGALTKPDPTLVYLSLAVLALAADGHERVCSTYVVGTSPRLIPLCLRALDYKLYSSDHRSPFQNIAVYGWSNTPGLTTLVGLNVLAVAVLSCSATDRSRSRASASGYSVTPGPVSLKKVLPRYVL
jgi:hypothetical protein